MSKRTSSERLQEAVGEMIAVEKGEAVPAVEHVYVLNAKHPGALLDLD